MRLDDVTVLDLTRLLPGPYATQLLADLGATVVKVEQPGTGDYARGMPPTTDDGTGRVFDAVNRGKESVVLDLKDDADTATFHDLAADADAVVEGFRPGVADRLGVGFEAVAETNPAVVYASLTGYGATGPRRDRAGHDLNYVGRAGFLDMTRRDETEQPRIPGLPVADMAGGLFTAFAVASALLARERARANGDPVEATHVDVSMLEVVLSFSQTYAPQALAGQNPRPGRTSLTGEAPWYAVYGTADDGHVTVAALEPQFWAALCDAVDRPDLADRHGTTDAAELAALREALADVFATRTAAEWEDALEDVDATVSRVLTPREAVRDDQVAARGLVVDDGTDRDRVGFPALVDGERPTAGTAPPGLDEHGERWR